MYEQVYAIHTLRESRVNMKATPAMSLVPSLFRALVTLDGDAAVMRVGEHPYIVTPSGHVELGSRGLTRDVIADLAEQLLSKEARAALNASGAVQYLLPSNPQFADQYFTVVANRGDRPGVVIQRSRPETGHSLATQLSQERQAPATARFPPLVLFIEDSLDQLDLYELALRDRYQFLGASDGEAGVKLAIAQQPDVLLVDLSMPRMDGWEVCRRVKNHPRTAAIPIIILTAEDSEDIDDQATSAGVANLLRKPCHVDALQSHIERVLHQHAA
jgi:two-component system cell cycle response regulator DivK